MASRTILALLLTVLQPLAAAPPGYRLAKERGVIYLDDILEDSSRATLKVMRATPVFGTKDAKDQLDTLQPGQRASLVAFTPYALRVRGQGTNGTVVGWANPRDFELPDPGFLDTLRQVAARREQVAKLIAAKQVALGMTTAEVAEALGRPTKRESRQSADGRTELWEYIDYEIVARYDTVRDPYTGALFKRFLYNEKIEKNKTSVEFSNNVVSSVSEKEDLSRKRDLGIVPIPLELRWP